MVKLTIRAKAVLATVVAALVIITLMGTYSFVSSWNILIEKTFQRELPAVLGEVSNDLNRQLDGPIVASQALASLPIFTQYSSSTSEQEITQLLSSVKQEFGAITSYFVSAKDNKYYIPDGILKTIKSSESGDAWFFNFIKSGKKFELSFDTDSATGIPTMFVNYAVINNGQRVGVAGIGLTLDTITQLISQYKLGENGFVFLVDAKGDIKIHPDKSMIGKSLTQLGVSDAASLLQAQDSAVLEAEIGGETQVIGAKTMPSIGWTLITVEPRSDVLADLNSFSQTMILMAIAIAVIYTPIAAWITNKLLAPFAQVATLLEDIGKGGGDLTQRLDDSRHDEVGQMAKGYNQFVQYLADLLRDVSNTGQEISTSVQSVDGMAHSMEQEIKQQTSQIEQVATAIHEMGASSEEVASSADGAAKSATSATDSIRIGLQSVSSTSDSVEAMNNQLQETTNVVNQLAQDASSIDTVLDVISGVSEQTNLLALNAAIEAARAGEQGRGFAVVADEVRTLASRSQASTEEIRAIIEQLQKRTEAVVSAIATSSDIAKNCQVEATNSQEQLTSISADVEEMNAINMQIASATNQQSNVVNEISPHVTNIAEIARQSDEMVERTAADCEQLKQKADHLGQLVSKFKF
ncbi:methyl-accepting chemotaxis protein [Vibrio sp. SCSIO 43135]|uniref:methyl-accepting chemotaxis protein n=1 Tax=Vibrio sp. SCSIO 43135 TaxID=2819096 RepID=UPI002074FCF3|nr:methyl-accepting chemotaxis protein [Vibrio sp. SCSIO 43135]USD43560.1 methyl-accepting chemotaxis protein [Vibrio sp. SCSIO 43135]